MGKTKEKYFTDARTPPSVEMINVVEEDC